MTTLTQLTSDVQMTLYGYGLSQPRATFLTQPLDDSSLAVAVRDASSFSQGIAEIGSELVFIESVDEGAGQLTLAPDGRGYFGSEAATYDANTRIEMAPPWPRQRIEQAVNDAILAAYPQLYGVSTTSFTFQPTVSTYSMPAAAERVIKVQASTIGPSQEQEQITRYSFNTLAPTDEFATGKSLTLEHAPFPGRTVTVTYARRPTPLAPGDEFAASGLAESAKNAIKYAACSELVAYMDTARLPVATAQSDEYDAARNSVGIASRLSVQLYQRYELELSKERDRLRRTYPLTVTMRKR